MQHPIQQIRDRLLQGLDKDYNVVDMGIVVDVISQLENYAITKEALETTRLGKHINELRRKASNKQLASRAKSLVKKWRELLMPGNAPGATTAQPTTPAAAAAAVQANKDKAAITLNNHRLTNGHHNNSSRLTSPAVSSSSRLSPGLRHPNHSSSLPSSASSSPGLSRPTTPSNAAVAAASSRPVSPAVPRTNVANKRLRKDDDNDHSSQQPPPKRQKEAPNNGMVASAIVGSAVALKSTCDTPKNGEKTATPAAATPTLTPSKKITRRKKQEQEREHLLEQKLLSARRNSSKVRTTQELVQELALRSSTPVIKSSGQLANETKTELMNRFFESQATNGNGHGVLSPPISDGAPSPVASEPVSVTTVEGAAGTPEVPQDDGRETVEDILAQLPPIDVASIMAEINADMQEDVDEEIEGLIPVKKAEPLSDSVKAAMVDELHTGQHESVNGNFTHDGAFKEWHEVVSKETFNGDLLYILPYSVID